MVRLSLDTAADIASMPKGKLHVHEVRLFDPKPRPIQGLAFETASSRLAVVRCCVNEEEGRPAAYFLEIWNLSAAPCLEFKIILSREWRESVEAVCWRSRRLLYVSGMHGHVLLVDVETDQVLKTAAAVSGPVWCLGLNSDKTRLAAGTEDGFVSLFNVEDEQSLEYLAVLEPKGSRVLSLSWHPSKPLLVSSGRGRLWLWDMERETLKVEMRPHKPGKEEVIVSSVLLLKNDTIVSGDSAGSTIFWDASTGTPLMTFHSHRSGVLSLAYQDSDEGLRVFASGIDSLITEMRLITNNRGASSTWVTATPRYYHTHDVRALCHTGKFLVSGGADAYLGVATELAQRFIKIPPNTDVAKVTAATSYVSPGVPLLLFQNATRLEVWQLSKNTLELPTQSSFNPADHFQLLKFTFGKGSETITATALSPNGEWLVASSARLTKAYRVVLTKDAKNRVDINIVAAQTSGDALSLPVDHFAFAGNSNLVVADTKSVYSCTAKWTDKHGQLSALVERKVEVCSLGPDERIRHLATSKNGQYVATVSRGNRLQVFDCAHPAAEDVRETEAEDARNRARTKWRVLTPPQSASLVTAVSLTDSADLLVAYANGTVASFGLRSLQYAKIAGVWKDSTVATSSSSSAYTHSSVEGTLAVLHNWKEGVLLGRDQGSGKWRVRQFLSYDEHLISSLLSPGGDLVNVVQTPSMLQNQLPPALAKKVFGV
ncbi:putative U3 [Hypsibius exemplaris]|uniref:U3 n=1 Tax=Hypsibius exemplaris TaxID=2072580 RepID=A0A9X6RLK9_HYPEX|nr:putative U3 [Hypsibius exemplaris]